MDAGWRFFQYARAEEADDLIYDVRPEVKDAEDARPADAEPTAAIRVKATRPVLAPWILPSGNAFIADPARRHRRPAGDPGADFPFVQQGFDDSAWESVDLPHDWAIAGPFMPGPNPAVGGGMGRLPSPGVGWYRRAFELSEADAGRSIFLQVDGAMAYAAVWLNGKLVGGWPYGYSSWQLDLTPYLTPGHNQLAIRLDNPPNSSRWYPGGGLYRDVRLVKTRPVHVAHWGTFVTTPVVSKASATIHFEAAIDNDAGTEAVVDVSTAIHPLDAGGEPLEAVAHFEPRHLSIGPRQSARVDAEVSIDQPRLWGPPPTQTPHRYVAVTVVRAGTELLDRYETPFGIRELRFDPERGLFVNGERIVIQGTSQHHDLGALGAAFHRRAAERQLEMLREMGTNAIRTAHNPPAPELLDLADRMGFLVVDENIDIWERKKTPLDFHLIFPGWHEQDQRALIRRDRNHPSVMAWSIGNEVGEQYTGADGARVAKKLVDITREEDPTRPTLTAMNYAKPDMPLPATVDIVSLNYQGDGIRVGPGYEHLKGIRTPPLYPAFHAAFPQKAIISTESAATVSSRGEYLFPVTPEVSAPVEDGKGGDPKRQQVSAYELYTAPFGSSPDRVFASFENHPYVAGGFVWCGWDYLGEPTPYYGARSSYFGIIDLAGFKKDRFYLYQSQWRPELPMAHILPHWTWPGREGEITPVHVFTSGDEAELFLRGQSLGKRKKAAKEYRLRWDDVRYQPGELRVVAYKNGQKWAEDVVQTAGAPAALAAQVDRDVIAADGRDLAFITVRVTDANGRTVPSASDALAFHSSGPAHIVATDNGDPTDFTPFPSKQRAAFHGLALVIVRGLRGEPGAVQLSVESGALKGASIALRTVQGDPARQ